MCLYEDVRALDNACGSFSVLDENKLAQPLSSRIGLREEKFEGCDVRKVDFVLPQVFLKQVLKASGFKCHTRRHDR